MLRSHLQDGQHLLFYSFSTAFGYVNDDSASSCSLMGVRRANGSLCKR